MITSCFSLVFLNQSKKAILTINLSCNCYHLVHGCGFSDDTYMKALPAHVAVDHNHKRFDNECSLALSKTSLQHSLTTVVNMVYR